MPDAGQPTRVKAVVRPLAPYEPPVDGGSSEPPPGQLSLPLRPVHCRAASPAYSRPRNAGDLAHRELNAVLCALVEVADGRRPLEPLRRRLGDAVYWQLRTTRRLSLGGRFVVRHVHRHQPVAGRVEVCATVHNPPFERAFAVAGALQRHRNGWRVTAFRLLVPNEAALRRSLPPHADAG